MLYFYYSDGVVYDNIMARIDISEPYEEYLNSLVKAGLFRSITAAAEAAIYRQMMEDERMRVSSVAAALAKGENDRSEEHTSELQSRENLVCRLLLENKNEK